MQGTFEECQQVEREHVCGICGRPLVTRWSPAVDGWEVVCLQHPVFGVFQRPLSPTQAYRQGYVLDIAAQNRIQQKEEKRMEAHESTAEHTTTRLPAIYEASKGELVKGELQVAAIDYARSAGLVPKLGHICLYHGKPWVTIDGWYYRFRQRFPQGLLTTRPMTKEEREPTKAEEAIHVWVAEAYEEAGGLLLSVGYGYAREGDEPLAYGSAVEPRWPWRLAEKRAEEDCLRKAVPLGLEEGEENVDRG